MTSEERHEARYQRRKAKREAKRRAYLDTYDDFDRATRPTALIAGHFDARRGTMWKYSPALYNRRFAKYSTGSSARLQSGKTVCQGYHSFRVVERGKARDVHSLHYTERVVRRSFCVNCLAPIFSRSLIYDNGACLKGKGGAFTEDRMTRHLMEFYRTYRDNAGYAITVDFTKYFANIDHTLLFQHIDRLIKDPRLNLAVKSFISETDKTSGTPGKGLYIGPEDSQILAIAFPNTIDHTVKDQWGLKWYDRYNDDSWLLVRTKAAAQGILAALLELYGSFKIIPNARKTQIVKLSRGFTFMKVKWSLTPTGKVLRRISRAGTVRERRKLKHFAKLHQAGEMTLHEACQSYMSWRGHSNRRRNSGLTIYNMDKLFYSLFGVKPWKKKGKR